MAIPTRFQIIPASTSAEAIEVVSIFLDRASIS
jgi:hypothetical protein